ncbi:MAG TPA: PilN domain-containing protein [Symbiobacteriaceae bacterium]|nr:PilN domain-containing protein [Symbiobacteriaceae bacterium]
MTVRINFLPKSYTPPKQVGPKEMGVAAGVALAVVAVGAYYSAVYAGTVDLERQIVSDQAKHESVKASLAEAEQIKAREARVAEAEQQLQVLAGREWSGVLAILSRLTPKRVMWTSLKANGDTITLRGSGQNLEDVAQLLGGLVTETLVDHVSLRTATEKGFPVAVTVNSGAKGGAEGTGKAAPVDPAQAAVDRFLEAVRGQDLPREMEFDLTITLVPAEGRNVQHGA